MVPLSAHAARSHVRQFDHTADLGLEIVAADLDQLFAAALLGLLDVVVDGETVRAETCRRIALAAADRERLLQRWLQEALYLYDAERWLAGSAAVTVSAGGDRLEAEIGGQPFDPARHQVKTEVKGVTYHDLVVHPHDGGWLARVILDL